MFPKERITLGDTDALREEGYAIWTAVAHTVAEFEPVTMVVDPAETTRARRMLGGHIEIFEAPVDELRAFLETQTDAIGRTFEVVDLPPPPRDPRRRVPGRRVVTVDARPLFDRGGGIHCITQQQPAFPKVSA